MRLTIEKLVYGGDGLARLESGSATGDARRKPVFLPFVLEGEQVEATLADDKGSFARARLASVAVPSPHRVTPPCQHFTRCGGCQYQHAAYSHQLEAKAAILRETLARTARLELACELQVHSGGPLHYRNRARLQVRPAPFALGYFRAGTNELLPVEQCPITSPLLNRALAALWQLGRAGQMPGGGEIELFASAEDDALLLELHNPASRAAAWSKSYARAFAEALHSRLPELRGVVLFPAAELAPARTSAPQHHSARRGAPHHPDSAEPAKPPEPIPVWGEPSLDYRVAARAYRVPAGAFFQGNRYLLPQLVTAVTSGAPGHVAFDLYAGVGLFAVALAERFERVTAVEVAPESYGGLQQNVPPHVQTTRQTTEAFLKDVRFRHALRHAELVVADPPRAGLGERVTRALADLQPRRIVYVSCDPATLARDLVTLLAAGYTVEQAHLFDLFPQTAHLETVLHLTRPQDPRP